MNAPFPLPDAVVAGLDPARVEQQRWFRHKGRIAGPFALADAWPVPDGGPPIGWWLLVRVPLFDGEAVYQLPIRIVAGEPAEARFILGTCAHEGETFLLVDGAHDAAMLDALLTRMRRADAATFRGATTHAEVLGPFPARIFSVRTACEDTSNTLCLADGGLLVKLYRCLDVAGTREGQMLATLARQGIAHIPAVRAFMEYRRDDGTRWALALAQEWLAGAQDAWTWLVDRLAGGPAEVGEELAQMADATAAIHRGLVTLGTRRWTDEDTIALKGRILRQIERLQGEHLASTLRHAIASAGALVERIAGADGGLVMPVHGDLHLGQMLRHEGNYFVVDFEGEPLASPAERMAWHSPLKDVAGMLRSFDYAASAARRAGAPEKAARWDAWRTRAEETFLAAYLARMPQLTALDANGRMRALSLYLLEKVTYEIAYELHARPEWVEIPAQGLSRVMHRIAAYAVS